MTLAPSVDSGLRQPLGAVEEGDVADLPRAALKSPPPSLECPGGTPGVFPCFLFCGGLGRGADRRALWERERYLRQG